MIARDPRDDSRRRGDQRFHRRLLRRDRGGLPADGRPGREVPLQEQLHLQVQRPPRHQGRRTVAGRRAGRRQAAPQQRAAGDCRTEISEEDNQPFIGRRSAKCWSKGRASPPASTTTTATAAAAHRPRRIATGSSCSTATAGRSARSCRSRSTTPTPSPCSARSSRSTSAPRCTRLA